MGKIPQGILGGVSGKVGSVVGGGWKGINYLRSKPLSVANPRTVAQVAQRDKMTYMVALAQVWLAVLVKPLWDRFAQKMSGYNDFVSKNISNVADNGEGLTDYSLLVLSKGKIEPTTPNEPTISAPATTVNITWPTTTTGQQSASDIAYVGIIYNNPLGDTFFQANGVARSVGTMAVPIDMENSGYDAHIYLSFKSADGRNVSGTGYVVTEVQS